MPEEKETSAKVTEFLRNKLKEVEIRKIEDCLAEAISNLLGEKYAVRISSLEYAANPLRDNKAVMTITAVQDTGVFKLD